MSVEGALAASRRLDRLLSPDGAGMTEIGGKRLAGELGGMLEGVRRAIDEAKIGLSGAVTELVEEVGGLRHVEAAIRDEARSVRELKTSILGNAVGGESGGQG